MKKLYCARVPSNIAFLKYWGKKNSQLQIPANNSLSMTLSNSYTETEASTIDGNQHELFYNKERLEVNAPFAQKVSTHLNTLSQHLKINSKLRIVTQNSFPSGCGIASSASGLGALTLSALSAWLDCRSIEDLEKKGFCLEKIASLARLGSGSACRSFFSGFTLWEKEGKVTELFNSKHWQLADTIVLISPETKLISSTEAHKLAWTSPLYSIRLAQIEEREKKIKTAISKKDLNQLGPLLEQEALEMHSIIMTSCPSVQYLNQASLDFLSWFIKERNSRSLPAYFTIDAGPNIHIISEKFFQKTLIASLKKKCSNYAIIPDHTGEGVKLWQKDTTN
tara:strand:- start:1873 stop:2883 length:1011 start_codon:yes stop_codon:yes gene_type:complete